MDTIKNEGICAKCGKAWYYELTTNNCSPVFDANYCESCHGWI